MKKTILSLLLSTALIACNNTPTPNSNATEQSTIQQISEDNLKSENTNKANEPSNVILGTWTGEMGEKKLTLVIEEINGSNIVGFNTLGSNKRNLTGTFTEGAWDQPCAKAYKAILNEPGDDEWDGVFTIKFVGYEDSTESDMGLDCAGNLKGVEAHGEWNSNNGKMKRDVHLDRQQ